MSESAGLMSHVQDSESFHFPWGEMQLPNFGTLDVPSWDFFGLFNVPGFKLELQLTKYMVIELIAAVLIVAIFVPLARRMRQGGPPKGKFWNAFEAVLLFLRDEVARPAIGHHEADRFLPYIWTIFFFILFCNLLGLVPWLGSPTGALGCTAVLALIAFVVSVGSGMKKFGPVGFVLGQVPKLDLPLPLAFCLYLLLLPIELLGIVIKHSVLAVRLLANMFAGHLVLAVVIGFIAQAAGTAMWYGVMPVSVFGSLGLNMLELLVAFLQAYIFTFLSALFIGMAVHQH